MKLLLPLLAALAWGGETRPDVDGPPPKQLSAWKLFDGQTPAEDMLPYSVNTPLFSDHADKHRFAVLPEGKAAVYDAQAPFEFPVGTVLVKTFAYGAKWIETRLLVRGKAGWRGFPYVWNPEMTQATLKPGGTDIEGVEWTDRHGKKGTFRYLVPNMNQCKACHAAGGPESFGPIGPTARQLNGEIMYPDGKKENQLARWTRLGKLAGAPAPEKAPRLARWDDPKESVNRRARAWLEINCAHCHNPAGPASTAGIDYRSSQDDLGMVGLNRAPVAAGKGTGGRALDIVAGKPEESIMVYRLESTDPGEMMPEVGRKLVDEDAVALIKEWIAKLPKSSPPR